MTFSEKLIQLRKQSNLSQEGLAEKLNVSRQSISRWEMGSAMPDANNLMLLSKLFGISTDYLLNENYVSDNDIPKVREIRNDNTKIILYFLLVLEVMTLILQFMTVVILENIFFSLLSFIPFICVIAGFEFGYQKKKDLNNKTTALFRKRLYTISAWFGTYFPARLSVTVFSHISGIFDPKTSSKIVFECIVLTIYICSAMLMTLSIEKNHITKNKGD
ncbi:MAG: helix-turn-helix transcriptional regulator [Lachnospiraceae bacterium]|nr:helix-turn-helix transcriptional regulator [Lachnospiraceae bacterium]